MAFDQPNQTPHRPPPQAQQQQAQPSEEWEYNNRYNPGPYPPSSYPPLSPQNHENYTYPSSSSTSWEQVKKKIYLKDAINDPL